MKYTTIGGRIVKVAEPKPPRMGKITPETVEVGSADDLLSALKFFAQMNRNEETQTQRPCHIGCCCEPCRNGACHQCTVDAMKGKGYSREEVQEAREYYRRPL